MILVTGATGLTGGALVRRLSATGIPVRALVRSAARADRLSALPAVEIVEGDMAHPAITITSQTVQIAAMAPRDQPLRFHRARQIPS